MINSLLDSIQNLITLSPSEKELAITLFKEKIYKKGDFFLAEGQICKQVGFVAKGLLRYYINHNGEEKTYAFSQENQYVCNYESFLPQSPSSAAGYQFILYRNTGTALRKIYKNPRGPAAAASQYHIASYVGVKPQSLSRIRKRISGQY